MATAVCNCPDDIGWLPEASWPLSAGCKSSAQAIYCVGGSPVIPPRGGYRQSVENVSTANLTFGSPNAPLSWQAGGTLANPTTLVGPGTSFNTGTITNDTCYPMDIMIHTALDMDLSTNVGNVLFVGPKITMSGGLTAVYNPQQALFGSDCNGQRCFRQYGFVGSAGTLAPGGVATITQQITYYYNTGGPSIADYVSRISMTTRWWGGTL